MLMEKKKTAKWTLREWERLNLGFSLRALRLLAFDVFWLLLCPRVGEGASRLLSQVLYAPPLDFCASLRHS